jgi:predicted aldo/keto reductase-like oxidoreductase
MEFRQFGKTGHKTSVLTLGGCGFGDLHKKYPEDYQQKANEAFDRALAMGINTIDVAPTYGEAEARLHDPLKKYRKKFFLAEKTGERTFLKAQKSLHQSLENLGVEYFDSFQFHGVGSMEELKQIFDKETGAIRAFEEAKQTGLIKNIGITVHGDMRVALNALSMYDDWSSILLPVYIGALVKPNPVNDFRPVLEKAQKLNIGVTAIKAIAKRRWIGEPTRGTWYEPLMDLEWQIKALQFTLSQQGVCTYSIPCDEVLWRGVYDAYDHYKQLSLEENDLIVQKARVAGFSPLFPE